MKTLFYAFLVCLTLNMSAQSLLVFSEDHFLYELDLNNCELRPISYHGQTYLDIAFHPNGNLYGMSQYGIIYNIDTLNSMDEFVIDMGVPSTFNSLTCSKSGFLYTSEYSGLIMRINIIDETIEEIGSVDFNSGGDMTFYNGNLYYAGTYDRIIKIDMNSIENSQLIINESAPGEIWGLTSIISGCDNTNTYAILSSLGSEFSSIYSLNFIEHSFDLVCEIDKTIFGSTAFNENYNSEINFSEVSLDSVIITNPECGEMNGAIEIYSTGNGTVLYSLNGQNFSENNSYENLGEQLHSIEIIDQLGCSFDTLINLTCNGTTSSFNTSNSSNPIKLQPNPTEGIVYVELKEIPSELNLSLFSSSGHPQKFKSIIEGGFIKLDISFLPTGIYFLTFNKTVCKIIKL